MSDLIAEMSQKYPAPDIDMVEEEDVLKFYYVRSLDDYWIGRRVGNFYFAEYDKTSSQWVWTHSRYLPWGEHVVAPDTLWKEHTYPSKPEEIPFGEWLIGFIRKYIASDCGADMRGVITWRIRQNAKLTALEWNFRRTVGALTPTDTVIESDADYRTKEHT